MKQTKQITREIISLTEAWEPKLASLPRETITQCKNSQNRTIKQILGHLIDSASNNTHRIVHLQYQPVPLIFPNYASLGNNDRWIAIQDYQNEDWMNMIQLWKYSFLHLCHVIENVQEDKLDNEWISGPDKKISLSSMIDAILEHLKLHLAEINELINNDLTTHEHFSSH
jgi:hypothetical protein